MWEYETKFCEIPSVMRVFVEHLHFAFFKQLDCLLAFPHQVVDENVEVFISMKNMHLIFVFGVDEMQSLVSVGKDIKDERWAVL